jgi:FkbM family methyltransferase
MFRELVSERIANALARLTLRSPPLERILVAGTRRPLLRRYLHLGAIAVGYSRVLGRRELRVAEMDGYRFYVNVGEPLGFDPYFFGGSGTAWITRRLIGPGDVCVDAGANAGHYTFLCASVVGATGRVFSFEPNPEFADLLRRSIGLNAYENVVKVEQRALYSVTGQEMRFFLSVNATNSGTSSLVDHGWYVSPERTIEVSTVAFDSFAKDAGVERFRLVKIDVERAEEFVIVGAKETLDAGRIDFLIVEMHAGGPAQDLLTKAGYVGFLIGAAAPTLVPLNNVEHDAFGDYLFVRPGLSVPGDYVLG